MLKNYLILIENYSYLVQQGKKKCLDLPGWRITLGTGSESVHRVPL